MLESKTYTGMMADFDAGDLWFLTANRTASNCSSLPLLDAQTLRPVGYVQLVGKLSAVPKERNSARFEDLRLFLDLGGGRMIVRLLRMRP